jgi:hypothetical protein
MQLRDSLLAGKQPVCPVEKKHTIHRHGWYCRYANCDELEKSLKVLRFLCYQCGHTISVLPDRILPYRALSAELAEEYFDAQAAGRSAAVQATENQRGCLKRAWHRFSQRLDALTSVLGQMLQLRLSNAKRIWNQLRRLGNLREILRFLSQKFKTSLLGDYQCLKPWSPEIS